MNQTEVVSPEEEQLILPDGLDLSAEESVRHVPFFQRPLVILVALVLAVLGIVYGATILIHSMTHESTDDAFIDAHIVTVAPKISGKILAVAVNDNQMVRKGDLLFEIDPRDAEAILKQRQAALEVARAKEKNAAVTVEQAGAHVRTLEAGYAAAAANAAASAADAAKERSDLKRNKELIAGGAISKQQLEHSAIDTRAAEATLDSKTKQLEAARAYADESKKSADASRAQEQAAAAEVKEAQAALQQQKLQVSYTKVTAPQAGRVTNKAIEPGDYVQVGQALMAIVPREIWVTANFKETQLTQMRAGQPAEIAVDAYPARKLRGHVESIQAGSGARFSLLPPENATGNFVKVVQRVPVRIAFDERPDIQQVLGPGMSAVPDVKVESTLRPTLIATGVAIVAIFLVVTGALLWLARVRRA